MTPRLVIVHERFTEHGGSEQVVEQLAALHPDPRVFAPVVDRAVLRRPLASVEMSSSPLQHLYRSRGRYAHLLPLLPLAMRQADLSDADVVIASHHAFANRVRVPDEVPLIAYVHSPARWMWDRQKLQGERGGVGATLALRTFATANRSADRAAANRVHHLIANSRTVANRILHWWGRHATVIHPPVDVDWHRPAATEREDFLLVAGRLVPYKRVDLAVAAATATGRRLIVAGDGRALTDLRAMAGPTVEFVGPVPDHELRDLYRRCAGLVFPGEEDFGIVPVEAQACGTPILAASRGGATETVVDGATGTLVDLEVADPAAALARAFADWDPSRFDPAECRSNAERFSVERFRNEMHDFLARRVAGWPRPDHRSSAPFTVAS